MTGWAQKTAALIAALALVWPGARPVFAQNSAQGPGAQVSATPQGGFVLKMNGELVLTNVVVSDAKTGELVRGLKQSDFSIYENGKQQRVASFDFESVDMAAPLNEATVSGLAAGPSAKTGLSAGSKRSASCTASGASQMAGFGGGDRPRTAALSMTLCLPLLRP